MMAEIENLRSISRRCLANQQLDVNQSRWLGASLADFLNHRVGSLDEALGLRYGRGGVPWWREEAIRKRNAALNELARRHYSDQSKCAKCRNIHRLTVRYAATAWRFDRTKDGMPATYKGTPKELVFKAFAAGAALPISERQLRKILVD